MQKDRKIIIIGGHEQACAVFDLLIENGYNICLCIIRQDDTGQDSIFPSLMSRAKFHDIPTLQPKKLNSPGVLSVVKQLNADIVLSLQNNMIIGEEWLRIFNEKLGVVNVHYAPLPKYGGYWPEMWAIWNGETEFAVTMHYVEKGLDSGPIIVQSWFEISSLETRESLYKKSTQFCYNMVKESLDLILSGKANAKVQDEKLRTYYPKGLPNEGFLDLSWDSETQSRFIRAISFPGFVGPKIKIGGKIYSILQEDIEFFKSIKINNPKQPE
jgi:methionyl-tRNA formyltransferase